MQGSLCNPDKNGADKTTEEVEYRKQKYVH